MSFWLYVLGLLLLFSGEEFMTEYRKDRRWWMRHLGTAMWAVGTVALWHGIGGS